MRSPFRLFALTATAIAAACAPAGRGRMAHPMMGRACEPAMRDLEEHSRTLTAFGADSLQAQLAAHSERLDNTLTTCGNEVLALQRTPDPEWTTTVAALRRDLTTIAHLEPSSTDAFLREHQARIAKFAQLQRNIFASRDVVR